MFVIPAGAYHAIRNVDVKNAVRVNVGGKTSSTGCSAARVHQRRSGASFLRRGASTDSGSSVGLVRDSVSHAQEISLSPTQEAPVVIPPRRSAAADPGLALVDSMPLPACLFARAYRCRRFKGEAAFGKDTLFKRTFYGFRVHARACWPGVIILPEPTERTSGLLVGDRNYHSPRTKEGLAGRGIELLAPYSSKKRDPHPKRSALSSRFRYRIDTVFSQLVGRYSMKRV